jgi:hypothetical protein
VLEAKDSAATESVKSPLRRAPALLAPASGLVAVGASTLYLSFNAGGFFVTAPALVAIAVLVVLAVRVVAVERPFAGFGATAAVAIGALALFALWTLLSAQWSGAPARALIEFDRALLYTATLALFASFPARSGRLQLLLGGLTAAIVVVAAVAVTTRVLPDVWPLRPNVAQDRLSYPLTYWNALGLLAGVGLLGALHFAASLEQRLAIRIGASMAVPLLATTLYLTLSRGSIAVTAAAVALYVTLARSRGLPSALIATVPASAVAVLVAYRASALTSERPTSALAVDQGHRVALVLATVMVGAGLLRWALTLHERRLRPIPRRLPVRPPVLLGIVVALLAGGLLASGAAQRAVEDFGDSNAVSNLGDQRSRLGSVSNNGRFDHWRVALLAFSAHPLNGAGAGTYQHLWAQHRESNFTVINAHSLYLGVLAELGIVGLLLLLASLVAIVLALARRVREPSERAAAAALLSIVMMWLLHAGVDWDWEMPAVTLWLFALGGAAMAVPPATADRLGLARRPTLRLATAICCLVVAVTPALLALSQIQLDRASRAYAAGDCRTAIDRGLASISVLGIRPQPYAIVGVCDVRLGADALGVRMLEQAVDRDPDDWENQYALALVQAAAGQDPREAAREVQRLNPLEPRTAVALRLYGRGGPREWRRRALAAPPPW